MRVRVAFNRIFDMAILQFCLLFWSSKFVWNKTLKRIDCTKKIAMTADDILETVFICLWNRNSAYDSIMTTVSKNFKKKKEYKTRQQFQILSS